MWYVVICMFFFKLGTKKQKQSSINGYQGVSRALPKEPSEHM